MRTRLNSLRRVLVVCILGLTTGGALSPAGATPGCDLRLTNTFVYRITKGHLVAHLIGTFHIGIALSRFPDDVIQMIDDATDVTTEAKAPRDPRYLRRLVLETYEHQGGPVLSQQLSEEHWRELGRRLEKNGHDPDIADLFTPYGATMMSLPNMAGIEAAAEVGQLDQQIKGRFDECHTHALESCAAQLKAMRESHDIDYLRKILSTPATDGLSQLSSRYIDGDADAFATLAEDQAAQFPRMHQIIYGDRNVKWRPRLVRRIRDGGRHVFTVGLVHLFGPQNLLDLIREAGFTVDRGV